MFEFRPLMFLMGVLLLSGCAELEVSPGKQNEFKNAPVNEGSRAGIVSYSKEAFDQDDERQEAYDEMAKSCHGAYTILKEEVKKGNGDYLNDKDVLIGLDDTRVYITFKCIR